MTEVDPLAMIEALKLQRNEQADQAAFLSAACEALKRQVAEMQGRIAELEAAP